MMFLEITSHVVALYNASFRMRAPLASDYRIVTRVALPPNRTFYYPFCKYSLMSSDEFSDGPAYDDDDILMDDDEGEKDHAFVALAPYL